MVSFRNTGVPLNSVSLALNIVEKNGEDLDLFGIECVSFVMKNG